MVPPSSLANTLQWEVFDVNPRTGFMPPQPPVGRLSGLWETWERLLDDARHHRLQPGDKLNLSPLEKINSEQWRARVRQTPLLPVDGLVTSAALLRRAHLVLTFLVHFYIHTLPPDDPIIIPRPISIPMLQVAKVLDLPPVITYSDTALYNWHSDVNGIRSQTTFTDLPDEEAFYLCSARIELRGADALSIMKSSMDEIFVGDEIAIQRLTTYLIDLAGIIRDLQSLLLDIRKGCDPKVYYNDVRPWFRGEDSNSSIPTGPNPRRWIFEGAGEYSDLNMLPPDRELSGASAGQSSMIHALDVFFGVNHEQPNKPSFMKRMQRYMPNPHRRFLNHLTKNPRPLRDFVLSSADENLKEAYNKAVMTLKEFRDSHMVIATLYIISPARKAAAAVVDAGVDAGAGLSDAVLKGGKVDSGAAPETNALTGTGGTDLVQFLKGVRNQTFRTLLTEEAIPASDRHY